MADQPFGDPFIFKMGNYEAVIPADRHYASNHMWAEQIADNQYRCGFSAYAVRLLQDVYFLEWSFDAPKPVKEKEQIGFIESSKAESDLYAPVDGTITTFNQALLEDPAQINVDLYGAGWLFVLEAGSPSLALLEPEAYLEHLAAAWKLAERTIKGQINE